ncbi:hypothetical protein Y900_011975 [Mycolicibacterium aromaticivorans JS19b1 = JCM 16368]|uniref:Uncharacterized protein n=1 Tax=Mycolicibacterium aromaticivorans JS19b1 = JCM 16368 TaxID=1440774 RepID=A0A064CH23_9MYCO|nr:hypothetical protein [Mycolicibacterium aromaticivorans]KDE99635.1 hypothetical protein Y900_011975 [Mycolicibacterium aromaticivorans JS19b1 = JCM 16368]
MRDLLGLQLIGQAATVPALDAGKAVEKAQTDPSTCRNATEWYLGTVASPDVPGTRLGRPPRPLVTLG